MHKFILLLTNVESEMMSFIILKEIRIFSGIVLQIKSIEKMGHHLTATNVKKNS
jgi:hypothetical protein